MTTIKRCPKCEDEYEVGIIIKVKLKTVEVCESCAMVDKVEEWFIKKYKGK